MALQSVIGLHYDAARNFQLARERPRTRKRRAWTQRTTPDPLSQQALELISQRRRSATIESQTQVDDSGAGARAGATANWSVGAAPNWSLRTHAHDPTLQVQFVRPIALRSAVPRIAPLPRSKYSLYVKIVDSAVKKMMGDSIQPIGINARVPGLVKAETGMERVFMNKRRAVPHRLLELVSLRTALEVGCSFCIDLGSYMATSKHGVTAEEVRSLVMHQESGNFSAAEVAALDLAVAMTATPPTVDDALVARVREHFSEQQVVELTAMIGWENFRARANATYGVESHGFAKADACAIPSASVREQRVAQNA